MGDGIKKVDVRAKQLFKERVKALVVVSPHSLEQLTQFAVNFVDFNEDVVATFGFHRDDIPAVMAIYNDCFPGRISNFAQEKKGPG